MTLPSAPILWTVAGLILIGLEALSPAFVLLFFGLGALLTALAALLWDMGVPAQLLLFAVSSVAALAGLRRVVRTIFSGRTKDAQQPLEHLERFEGSPGLVTEAIAPGMPGRIKVRGSFYAAVADQAIAAGQAVVIVEDLRQDHSLFRVEPERQPQRSPQ